VARHSSVSSHVPFRYWKTEGVTSYEQYDFVISELRFISGFEVDESILAFAGINRSFPPSILFEEKMFIHRKLS
jgi:hypothetical protein